MKDYEKVYNEFWKGIIENKDGVVNIDQVKRELSDYYFMLNEVPKVYCEVTNDNISKPNTYAYEVLNIFRREFIRPSDIFYGEDLEDIIDDDIDFEEYILTCFKNIVAFDNRDGYDKKEVINKIQNLIDDLNTGKEE